MSHNSAWILSAVALIGLTGIAFATAQTAQDKSKAAMPELRPGEQLATLAGGCFWCMEPPFEGLHGLRAVISGYTGGDEKDPSYAEVAGGRTGHTEAIQIVFDPQVISYQTLLEIFWQSMDPTDAGGQFADRGKQYRPGIFVHDDAQRKTAEQSKAALAASGRFKQDIVVAISDYEVFYPAEEYHQDYYLKNTEHYKAYRKGSGRTGFLNSTWGDELNKYQNEESRYQKPSATEIRERLDDMQYRVTQQEGTEPPFKNLYWDNKQAGIYVDVVSGEPLFSSKDKFKSGTGWPSFFQLLNAENIIEKTDGNLGMERTEVRSKHGDSHLGHLFPDGPAPTGLRYCINSAALRFIPIADLEKEGYGHFVKEFAAEQEKKGEGSDRDE